MTRTELSAVRLKKLARWRSSLIVWSVVLESATLLPAEELKIGNAWLAVEVETSKHAFAVRDRRTGRAIVPSAHFVREIRSAARAPLLDDVWGRGSEVRVTHVDGWQSSLRLFDGSPFLQLETLAWNGGDTVYASDSEELLSMDVDLGLPVERLRSYGTGGLFPPGEAPGSFSFTAIVDSRTRRGLLAAFLTHERGSGVLFTDVVNGRPRIRPRIDFGRFEVRPGAARRTETVLIGSFEDTRRGLEAYADAVARQYSIEPGPMPSVYCSWYHAGASDERRMIANGEFVREHLAPYGLTVLQIDDHWQKRIPEGIEFEGREGDLGDGGPIKVFVESNEKFPRGMAYTAERLRSMGLVPGIWFMPFAGNWKNPYFSDKQEIFARRPDGTPFTTRWSGTILDLSHPRAQRFVRERVRRITDWGYRYFKLDGMHTGAVCHNVYVNTGYSTSGRYQNVKDLGGGVLHDPSMTHIEAYRKGLEIVREAAGPDVYILGCNVSQNMRSMGAAFGRIDAMRIGPDNGGAGRGRWNQVIVGARHGTNLYFLNRRVWHNDPDPVYVRPSNPLERARLMVSWVAVSGSLVTTSYQFADLPPERLELLKRCMPSHAALARPVDLFEEEIPRIWLLTSTEGGTRRDVVGLFNWNENEAAEIVYDMGKLGLDADTEYVAFDFWANRFLDPVRGTLDETLPAGSCRVLALRPEADHPQLLSTSRHITQGVVDVVEERWDAGSKTLSGESHMIRGDPYELRVLLPKSGAWRVAEASSENGGAVVSSSDRRGLRVRVDPEKTETARWRVRFK